MTTNNATREAVRQRNSLYFKDLLDQIDARLPSLPYPVIAAACAERLLARHLRLPEHRQRPFTASWRYPMDCIWGILKGDANAAGFRAEVVKALRQYYDSPLNHSEGQDGPDDADHDPAAACIYAAESLVQSSPKTAVCAVSRLVDDAFSRAEAARESTANVRELSDFVEDCCNPVVQYELQWILALVNYADTHALTEEFVIEVRNQAIA